MDCKFTLKSEYPPLKIPSRFANSTASELLLERAAFWAGEGKTVWNVDAETGVEHTFAEFEPKTRSVGSSLFKLGMRESDTLIYMTTDLNLTHIVIMGVWRANGKVQAVYPEENEDGLLRYVEDNHVGWILCDFAQTDLCMAVAAKCKWSLRIITTRGSKSGCILVSELFQDDGLALPPLSSKPSDVALLLCTSGTTGPPKAAAMTHESLLNRMAAISRSPWVGDKLNLVFNRPTHSSGAAVPFGLLIAAKTCLTLTNQGNQENIFKVVHKFKPGLVCGIPVFLTALVDDPDAKKYDFRSVEVCVVTGIQLTTSVEDTLMKLPNMRVVFNMHGMTETGLLMSTFDFDERLEKLSKIKGKCHKNIACESVCGDISHINSLKSGCPANALGKPIPGVEVQIRDTVTGVPLGPNTNGEICVKPCGGMPLYYKNVTATESAFIDGWFKTGDLGIYDENGFVFMIGRLKEVYSCFGNHVSPSEIENVILKHPAVSEAVVAGIEDPDPPGCEWILKGFVKLKPNVSCDPEEIKLFAHDKLPGYKHLNGGIHIVDEFPKTKTGKISRQLLLKLDL